MDNYVIQHKEFAFSCDTQKHLEVKQNYVILSNQFLFSFILPFAWHYSAK